MAIAAVPAYLGQKFATASPGLRFGMYLPLWGVDARTGERLWATFDQNYRVAGQGRQERLFRDENKASALNKACRLNDSDKDLMTAHRTRQAALAASLGDQVLSMQALSVAPFATGLGNEHPLENGFAFLNPYGLPYLAGSGVKGVLRAGAAELADGLWGDTRGWTAAATAALFGSASERDEDAGTRGALIVWDVLPEIVGNALRVDVMTAHHSHYLQGQDTPHESGQPNPINFLTVPPGSRFDFHIQCDLPFLQRIAPELAGNWKSLVQAALHHAFDWLGFGAKTAVGYGAMQPDPEAERRRRQREAERAEAAEQARQQAQRQAELQAMSPVERAVQECLDEQVDPNIPATTAIFNALKAGRWQDKLKRDIAEHLRQLLEGQGKWKLQSTKKNPKKDKEHQNTLQVQRWIEGD